MGGYTSGVDAPSAARFRRLIAPKQGAFVLLTGIDSKSGISTPKVFEVQA